MSDEEQGLAAPTLTRTFPSTSSGHSASATFTAGNLPSDPFTTINLYEGAGCLNYLGSGNTDGQTRIAIPIEFYQPATAKLSVDYQDSTGLFSPCSNSASYTYLGPEGEGGGTPTPPEAPAAPSTFALYSPSSSPGYDATPEIRFTGLSASTTTSVRLYSDAGCTTQIGSGSVYSSSAYVTVTSPLSVGAHQIHAKAFGSGGESACSASYVSYTLVALPVPSSLTLVTPASSPGSDPTPMIQVGGLGTGMSVALFSDSGCTTQVQSQTSYGTTATFSLSAQLAIGTHTFYARTSNELGSSACSTASLTYELQASAAPSIALFYPAASSHHSSYIELGVGVLPSYGTVAVFSDSSCTTQLATGSGSGTIRLEVHGLAAGTHQFWARIAPSSDLSASPCSSSSVSYTLAPRLNMAPASALLLPYSSSDLEIGDFNGDTYPDLVASMSSGTTAVPLYFYAGNGDGTFQSAVSIGSFAGIVGMTSGDFDGDGDRDLAVIQSGARTLSVLPGAGNGTFGAAVSYPTGVSTESPVAVASGDLDTDGDLDLVVANSTSSTGSVSAFLGNGDGTFAAQASYTSYYYAGAVFVTDLNGDAKADVLVGHDTSPSLSAFLGNGDGTLQARISDSVNPWLAGIAIGDLDADGYTDVAQCVDTTANSVSIALGSGDGTFGAATEYATYSGSYMGGAAIGDLDGDGHQDVVAGHYTFKKVSVAYGDGTGSISPAEYFGTTGTPKRIRTADLDSDGDLDLLVTVWSSDAINVLLNQGAP